MSDNLTKIRIFGLLSGHRPYTLRAVGLYIQHVGILRANGTRNAYQVSGMTITLQNWKGFRHMMTTTMFAPIRSSRTPLTMDQIRHAAPSAFATEPYHAMSDKYAYIPTSAVIEGMMSAGLMPFSASQSRTRIADKREFTKHMIRFRPANMELTTVGQRFPEIVLINGHDGSTAYKLMAGIFELVCSNGLIVADSLIASLHIAHKGNIIQSVTQGSVSIVDSMPKVIEAVSKWQQIQLTAGEQTALAEAAHYMRFADSEGNVNTPIQPAQLLLPRRSADNKPDLWSTFNRVQENVIKGGLHARDYSTGTRPRNVSTRGVKGIDQDVKLNRALWMLGEKMAEYRQVA